MVVLVDGVVHHWHQVPAITRRMWDTLYTSLLRSASKLIHFLFGCFNSLLHWVARTAEAYASCFWAKAEWMNRQFIAGKETTIRSNRKFAVPNLPHMYVLGLWVEARVPRVNPRRLANSTQKGPSGLGVNPSFSYCGLTVLLPIFELFHSFIFAL